MKGLSTPWLDVAALRTTLFGNLTLIVASILIAFYGRHTLHSLEARQEEAHAERVALEKAETALESLNRARTMPAYQRIHDAAGQSVAPRLAWIEFMDRLRQHTDADNLRFELGAMRPSSVTAHVGLAGKARFYVTPVVMSAEFHHESTLFKLLDALSTIPDAAAIVDRCDLVRTAPTSAPTPPAHRLSARCDIRFVYLITPH